jgi:PucR C-terminal helix-turn-helix domain/GGDEF-like domain
VVHVEPRYTSPDDLTARSAEIADAVAEAVASDLVPISDWLADEYKQAGFQLADCIERTLELAASGEPLSADDIQAMRGIGAEFARNHAPLSLLVASLEVGIVAIMRESWRTVPADRFADMTQFTEQVARLAELGRQVALHGYLETRAEADGRPEREILAEALISGECSPETVQALGERLAPSYLVLACAVPDPARVDSRQLAAIHRAIDDVPGSLHCGDPSALVILLPGDDAARPPEEASAELFTRLRALAGQPVHAARALRPDLAGIPCAHKEACEALSLVKALPDAGAAVYQMDGLLLELSIARQPDIRRRLAALLAPLDARPDLLRTLDVLLACDLDRERTASELYIHRRTLRYRLDRIKSLSGIDPHSARGIQLLRAALTADRLPELTAPDPPGGQQDERSLQALDEPRPRNAAWASSIRSMVVTLTVTRLL